MCNLLLSAVKWMPPSFLSKLHFLPNSDAKFNIVTTSFFLPRCLSFPFSSILSFRSSCPYWISRGMGICLSTEERESRQRSYEIDKQLEEDNRRLRQECKLLLLGTGKDLVSYTLIVYWWLISSSNRQRRVRKVDYR